VADQAFAARCGQCGAERGERGADAAVCQFSPGVGGERRGFGLSGFARSLDPDAMLELRLFARVAEPADERGDHARGDLRQLQSRREVPQCVLGQQRAVVAARLFAEPAAAGALVAVDPSAGLALVGASDQVLVEREPRALLELAAADVRLPRRFRAARLFERAAGLPPLPAVDAVREDVTASALEDPGGACAFELRRHQFSPVDGARLGWSCMGDIPPVPRRRRLQPRGANSLSYVER
jgi:hypothetical protein